MKGVIIKTEQVRGQQRKYIYFTHLTKLFVKFYYHYTLAQSYLKEEVIKCFKKYLW